MPSMPRGGRRQLAAARSQSRGSSEPPAHEPLATGSKTETMTKRKTKKKKKKTEKKHAADSDVDVQSAKRKAQPRPPDRVPAIGGIVRGSVAKMRKRAIVEGSLSPFSDLDSRSSSPKEVETLS